MCIATLMPKYLSGRCRISYFVDIMWVSRPVLITYNRPVCMIYAAVRNVILLSMECYIYDIFIATSVADAQALILRLE